MRTGRFAPLAALVLAGWFLATRNLHKRLID
jgi:hypothetical protein